MKVRILKKAPFVCALVAPYHPHFGATKELWPQIVTGRDFLNPGCVGKIVFIEAPTAREAWKRFLSLKETKDLIKRMGEKGYIFSDTMHN